MQLAKNIGEIPHGNQFSKFQQFNVRIFDIFDTSNMQKLSEKHIKVIKNNVKCCKTNHLINKIDFRGNTLFRIAFSQYLWYNNFIYFVEMSIRKWC